MEPRVVLLDAGDPRVYLILEVFFALPLVAML